MLTETFPWLLKDAVVVAGGSGGGGGACSGNRGGSGGSGDTEPLSWYVISTTT